MRRVGPCVLLLALAGCVPGSQPAFDNDPLFGGPRLPRNGAVAAAPKPAATTPGPVPLPPTGGPASPAALASGSPAADASPLRIGPPPATPTAATHDGDVWQTTGATAGVALQQPQPLADSSAHPGAVIAPPTIGAPVPAAPAVAPDPYAQLQDQLALRGVLFQSLEGPDDSGVWRFRCGVPKRGEPGSIHNIETSAVGEHGLAAIRMAIDQMDRDGP